MRAYNSVLTYNIPTGIIVYNEITGNPEQQTRKIVLHAFLRQNNTSSSNVITPQDQYFGVDINAMPMVGRLVSPSTLPLEIEPYTEADAIISNYSGKFYIVPYVQSDIITIVPNRVIKGWFVINNQK